MAPKKAPAARRTKGVAKSKARAAPTKPARNHNKRGVGLKFNAESYELIARCTAQTRIRYAPNPKRPGSKSFDRYKRYEKCHTVGEALKHCKPADLLWEYERGYLKLLGGPMSDRPACMLPPSKDPAIKILQKFRGPQGCSIKMDPAVRKKLADVARAFDWDLDQLHEEA